MVTAKGYFAVGYRRLSVCFRPRAKRKCTIEHDKGDFFAKKSPSFKKQFTGLFFEFTPEKSDGQWRLSPP